MHRVGFQGVGFNGKERAQADFEVNGGAAHAWRFERLEQTRREMQAGGRRGDAARPEGGRIGGWAGIHSLIPLAVLGSFPVAAGVAASDSI